MEYGKRKKSDFEKDIMELIKNPTYGEAERFKTKWNGVIIFDEPDKF